MGKAMRKNHPYTFVSELKMKTHLVVLVLQCYVAYVVAKSSCQVVLTPENALGYILDYYWRDYVGIIPLDAVPGGKDDAGRPSYIGQVYFKDWELLPATIYSGCKSARACAHDKELHSDKNVKILCSNNISKFEWVTTKNEETDLLTNYHFVIGGFEVGHSLKIGRVNHEGETIVGKIFSNPLSNRGLWIPYNGSVVRFLSYEILAYKLLDNPCHSCDVAPGP